MTSSLDLMSSWANAIRYWQNTCLIQAKPSASAAKQSGLTRAHSLIDHARKHSPFYAQHYSAVAPRSPLESYPSVNRTTLMHNFDNWACDRRITLKGVKSFLSSPGRIGHNFLNNNVVWTSSGTTGEKGIYIQDTQALSIYQALMTVRFSASQNLSDYTQAWTNPLCSNHMAMVAALEGHFAGIVFWEWATKLNPWFRGKTKTISILQPVSQIIEQLNHWQPQFLSSYPSLLTVLANEQKSGRLTLSPHTLWCGGENLDRQQKQEIENAFGCEVVEDYGASEAMNMAFACKHGKLHINTDWFILEPVDENMQTVPAGVKSASTLVTNLANSLQPIIRYDIGDSITLHEDACTCKNPLPTMEVVGRNDDTLWLKGTANTPVPILPLTLNTVIEENAGVFGFQIIQHSDNTLIIRTEGDNAKACKRAYMRICNALRHYFLSIGIESIKFAYDPHPPERDPVSGKLNQVKKATDRKKAV